MTEREGMRLKVVEGKMMGGGERITGRATGGKSQQMKIGFIALIY